MKNYLTAKVVVEPDLVGGTYASFPNPASSGKHFNYAMPNSGQVRSRVTRVRAPGFHKTAKSRFHLSLALDLVNSLKTKHANRDTGCSYAFSELRQNARVFSFSFVFALERLVWSEEVDEMCLADGRAGWRNRNRNRNKQGKEKRKEGKHVLDTRTEDDV